MGFGDFVRGLFSKGDDRVNLSITRDEADKIKTLVEKERREIAFERHELVDKAALEGKTLPIGSIVDIDKMTGEARRSAEELRLKMRAKYGDEIPLNTAHRLSCEWRGEEQIWSEYPGCFERHLQRRDGACLFPPERRIVTYLEIIEAQDKDRELRERFQAGFEIFTGKLHQQGDSCDVAEGTKLLQETQDLLEELAAVGGPMEHEERFLAATERGLIKTLSIASPATAEDLQKIHSLSCLARIPFLAQMCSEYRPMPNDDAIPGLLSEDLSTIASIGIASRAFGPDFRPNDADIRSALDSAVEQGYSKAMAGKILTAWAGYE